MNTAESRSKESHLEPREASRSDVSASEDLPSAGTERNTRDRKATSLAEVEREHIMKILEGTNWRIEGAKGAAGILGMNPATLRSRMKKLGIQRPNMPRD